MKINLSDYTWEEVRDLAESDPVILLPLGAFEQHGKHLPLKVDEFMVNNIANEAVRKAHQKNIFGQTVYKFFGIFRPDIERTNPVRHYFKRESKEIILNKYFE